MSKSATSAIVLALVIAAPLSALAATSPSSLARSGAMTAPLSEKQAMSEIRADGYTNVQDLRKSGEGWTAKAKEGGKQVSLSVNSVLGVRKM
jgi:hypothetical protein